MVSSSLERTVCLYTRHLCCSDSQVSGVSFLHPQFSATTTDTLNGCNEISVHSLYLMSGPQDPETFQPQLEWSLYQPERCTEHLYHRILQRNTSSYHWKWMSNQRLQKQTQDTDTVFCMPALLGVVANTACLRLKLAFVRVEKNLRRCF